MKMYCVIENSPRWVDERKTSIFWSLFIPPVVIILVILGAKFL
jgi:hypothetical protein